MAWAWAELLSTHELHEKLNSYPGIVRHPSPGNGNVDCPTPGSLESLNRRYMAAAMRFDSTADRKGQTFRRRPKPKWRKVNYEGTGSRFVLELRRSDDSGFVPWPLERAAKLVELLRDAAVEKLKTALPGRSADIDRVLIGRKPDGENSGPTSARVRIVPLPSIGHPQADWQIRRVLVDVPADCPLRPDDISWAVSGIQLTGASSPETVEVTRSAAHDQLRHYGTEVPARRWRSVTPLALPAAARRRIDPKQLALESETRKRFRRPSGGDSAMDLSQEAKAGQEKYTEHAAASSAVAQALRHAGIRAGIRSVRFQREPFERIVQRVEPFADSTRFSKHRLWHVDLELELPVTGPLVIGDGRFLGLGLMQPVRTPGAVLAFSIESGLNANPDPIRLSRALRRAVIARLGDFLGPHRLPAFFTGHRADGAPARAEKEPHLAFVFDPQNNHLLIVTPNYLDRRLRCNREHVTTLEMALQDFRELRAGGDGHLRLRPLALDLDRQPLFATSNVWESVTPYHVNRHAKRSTPEATLMNDLIVDCGRRGLPRPDVTVLNWTARSGHGLSGQVRLTFKHAVQGHTTAYPRKWVRRSSAADVQTRGSRASHAGKGEVYWRWCILGCR
mgnify:FL=1